MDGLLLLYCRIFKLFISYFISERGNGRQNIYGRRLTLWKAPVPYLIKCTFLLRKPIAVVNIGRDMHACVSVRF